MINVLKNKKLLVLIALIVGTFSFFLSANQVHAGPYGLKQMLAINSLDAAIEKEKTGENRPGQLAWLETQKAGWQSGYYNADNKPHSYDEKTAEGRQQANNDLEAIKAKYDAWRLTAPGFVDPMVDIGLQARKQFLTSDNRDTSLGGALQGNPDDKIPSVCATLDGPCHVVRAGVSVFHLLSRLLGETVLRLSNILFNQVFGITVRNFSTYGSGSAIEKGWTISRDLVNISLIFILIYAALGLILGLGSDQKKIVSKVIVVALLVNFSAMFTGIAIDASNILANQFYEAAGNLGGTDKSLGDAPDITTGILKRTLTGINASRLEQEVATGARTNYSVLVQVVMNDLLNLPFFIITSVVLVAASLMFFVRMITLIFLIMLAPLAFLAYTLASTQSQFNKWLKKLIDNCLFAPAFFFLFMVTIMALGGPLGGFGGGGGGDDTGFIQNFIYLVIVNGMMVACLLIAKEFGAYGADGAMGVLNRMKGAVGRNTLGRAGTLLNDGIPIPKWVPGLNKLSRFGLDDLRDWSEENKWGKRIRTIGNIATLGGLEATGVGIKSTTDTMAQSKFGGTASREDIIKKEGAGAKLRKGKPDRIAAYISGLSWQAQKDAYAALSTRERADIDKLWRKNGNENLAERLRDRMVPEEQDKMEKAHRESEKQAAQRESKKVLADTYAAYEKARKEALARGENLQEVVGQRTDEETGEVTDITRDMTLRKDLRKALRGQKFMAESLLDYSVEQIIDMTPDLKSSHYAYVADKYPLGAGEKKRVKDARFRKILNIIGKKNSDNDKVDNYAELFKNVVTRPPTEEEKKADSRAAAMDQFAFEQYAKSVGKVIKNSGINAKDMAGLDEGTFLAEPAVIANLMGRDMAAIQANQTMPNKWKILIKAGVLEYGTEDAKHWLNTNMFGTQF